jgi:hypothetical protein
VGTRGDLAGEVKASKGESQKRCECETKLTRAPREEAVKRVAKP